MISFKKRSRRRRGKKRSRRRRGKRTYAGGGCSSANGGETNIVFLDDGWIQTVEIEQQDVLVIKTCKIKLNLSLYCNDPIVNLTAVNNGSDIS